MSGVSASTLIVVNARETVALTRRSAHTLRLNDPSLTDDERQVLTWDSAILSN